MTKLSFAFQCFVSFGIIFSFGWWNRYNSAAIGLLQIIGSVYLVANERRFLIYILSCDDRFKNRQLAGQIAILTISNVVASAAWHDMTRL